MNIELTWNDAQTVATVTLNRPEALNALTVQGMNDIARAIQQADARGARVILLRGAGRSFCAGADRRQYPGYSSTETNTGVSQSAIEIGVRLKRAVTQTNALTVAQIHGHALGGGLVLALFCDLRFAAEDAQLSLPELRLGLPLGWGALYRLVELVGTTRAWAMLTDCTAVSGRDGVDIGLISAAYAAAELEGKVHERVENLLQLDPEALFLTKRQFRSIAARASFGNIEELDGALLLGPLQGPHVRERFAGL